MEFDGGFFDKPTSVGADFSASGYTDEEIAHRLQAAEFSDELVDEIDVMDAKVALDSEPEDVTGLRNRMNVIKEQHLEQKRAEAEAEADKLRRDRMRESEVRRLEQKRAEAEVAKLRREKEYAVSQAKSKDKYLSSIKKTLELAADLQKKRAKEEYVYITYNPFIYRRIYDWAITVIPEDLNYFKKQELKKDLASLIKDELKAQRSEEYIVRMVKEMFKPRTVYKKVRSKKKSKKSKKKSTKSKKKSKKSKKKSKKSKKKSKKSKKKSAKSKKKSKKSKKKSAKSKKKSAKKGGKVIKSVFF